MPWPRPRRALCFLCVASCESVASSFGVQSFFPGAEGACVRSRGGDAAVNMVRGGGSSRGSRSGTGAGSLGMATGGVHDSDGSGGGSSGGGSSRQGVPVVRAASQAQQEVAFPPATAPEIAGEQERKQEPIYKPARPPPSPPAEEGED